MIDVAVFLQNLNAPQQKLGNNNNNNNLFYLEYKFHTTLYIQYKLHNSRKGKQKAR